MKQKEKLKTHPRKLTLLLVAIIFLLFIPHAKAQDTSWYSESDKIYTLTTADQIQGLRDLVNSGITFSGKIIKLGNDIDLGSVNWSSSIGDSEEHPFSGMFDGCNYTISFSCSYRYSSYKYFGLFGKVSGEITRLIISGSINVYSTKDSCYIGGICGYNNGVITKCKNNASISSNTTSTSLKYISVGGICGCSSSSSTISYCINEGSIDISSKAYTYVGGICGDYYGNKISCCENTNTISGAINKNYSNTYVGGIAGRACYTSFEFCRNTGRIYSHGYKSGVMNTTASAGGILGYRYYTVSIDDCYVASDSITISTSAFYNYAGHILGGWYVSSYVFINNCYGNSDCSIKGKDETKTLVDTSYSSSQMSTIEFVNKLNEQGYNWVGGEGVFPIPLGSMCETEEYTTYKEPEEISFEDNAIDMAIGDRKEIKARVLPIQANQKLTWVSSNPDVVSVDEDGVLWSLGLGDAVITATSLRNNAITATCYIHVGTKDVKSIMLPESVILKMNESKTIERTIIPSYANYNLTWESVNEQVATVDQNGKVTGINFGKTEITVTDNLTNVQATCAVSVAMEIGDTFKAHISNGAGTVSTTFMLTDLENRYVSIGDGVNAAIATTTTGSITIPETIMGLGNLTYTVTSIGCKAFASSKISSVTIPSGITAIGDDSFNGCSSLTSVTVESTEPLAINSTCFSVKSNATLHVPKGCYEVYRAADVWKDFGIIVEPPHTNGDTFAASITAGSGTTDAVFKVIDATNKYVSVGRGIVDDSFEIAIDEWTEGNVVILSTVTGYDGQAYQVKQISDGAFFGCFEVTSIELPNGIATIGYDAFYQCSSLVSFTIPATVTTIGDGAFNGCNNITSINIPSNVTSLGTWAFAGCSKLTSVTVNRSEPLAIDDKCFTNAKNATLNVPKGAYKKYASAENWKNFITIKEPAHSAGDTFAASVTAGGSQVDATFKVTNTSSRYVSIGDGEDSAIDIFASGNVVIPSSVKGYDAQAYTIKKIADAAFFGCENITSVSLPSVITEIGNSAFLRCYNLASINIPTNVTKIGAEAFFYCEKLTSISIPKNVTSIGTRAFKNCNQLTSVTVGRNTPISIDAECFSNAANATLNVPYGSKERYEAATGWKQFKNIVEMAPKDGDVFTAQTAEGVKMTFMVINASAKTCKVGDGSSASISTSTSGLITIPTTANGFAVTQISSKAFYNCNQITATEIPTCISSIGTYAFSGCNNLISVTVDWDEPISISTNCFSNAANATLYVPIGRNKYYKAATGWKDFGLIANKTESRLFADDVIVCRGGQIILPINLSNEEAIRQVHFELSLPEGISVATGQQATLTQRANSTHIITANPLSNGNYEFNIMSKSITSDKTIEGTEGCIANIYLKVWKSTAPNDYGIGLTDCELSIDGTSSALLLSDSQSKLTVSNVMLGDTNDDERISVTDISNIIDYILHKQVDNFVLHAADVNGDGRLTVTDISTIIDIILHKVVFEETQATRKEELDQQ